MVEIGDSFLVDVYGLVNTQQGWMICQAQRGGWLGKGASSEGGYGGESSDGGSFAQKTNLVLFSGML